MISATLLIAAAAGVLFLWPSSAPPAATKVPPSLSEPVVTTPLRPLRPSYNNAMNALALVRTRLSQTETLTDKEKECITSLTVALIGGSDR